MNQFNKVAALFAIVSAAGAVQAQAIDNWRATDGTVVKNGTNELCWRNSSWTPATAYPGCDGAALPPPPSSSASSSAVRAET